MLKKAFQPLLIIFGIIMPIMALSVELTTHVCAGAFFDPIPTLFHQLSVALVPIAGIFAYRVLVMGAKKELGLACTLNGFAFCISLFYAVYFLPLLPVSIFALVVFGLGVLCWAPALAFFSCWQVRSRLKDLMKAEKRPVLPVDLCLAMFLIALGVLEFPQNMTLACQSQISAKPETAAKNLLLLRAFADKESMLRSCYGLSQLRYLITPFNTEDWDLISSYINLETAREIFYRVTGKSFNSVPRPALRYSDRYTFMDDDFYDYYDHDFAGAAVGGIVKGLKLVKSRLGGEFDANAAIEHLVWTMQFEKDGWGSRELRAQVLLPPGSVVSGCWLNINGERRDAVFQARASARTNYEKQARSGQQGLHISTTGPGRVLFQAPAVSGNLELCIEIDAPMKILDANRVLLSLPALCERNFEIDCKNDLSVTEIQESTDKVSVMKASAHTRIKEISYQDLFDGPGANNDLAKVLEYKRNPKGLVFVSDNPYNQATEAVESIEKVKMDAAPLYLVVDGSASMSEMTGKIIRALRNCKFENITLVWASDNPLCFARNVSSQSPAFSSALARLADSACVGGQDNAAAIMHALESCPKEAAARVFWIHGAQSTKLGKVDLASLLKNYPKTYLYEYQCAAGPNELLKALDSSARVVQLDHVWGAEKDISKFLAQAAGEEEFYQVKRKLIKRNQKDKINAASFLSRLAAADWLRARLEDKQQAQTNSKIAESYRIITPLTSAVVLMDPPQEESQRDDNGRPQTQEIELKNKKEEKQVQSQTSSGKASIVQQLNSLQSGALAGQGGSGSAGPANSAVQAGAPSGDMKLAGISSKTRKASSQPSSSYYSYRQAAKSNEGASENSRDASAATDSVSSNSVAYDKNQDQKGASRNPADEAELSPLETPSDSPADAGEVLEHDPSLIPTKPEPPLSTLMLCLLALAGMVCIIRKRLSIRRAKV